MASGSGDDTVRIWETSTGTCVSTLTVDSTVCSVAFSPDGTKLASGSYDPGAVHIWSVGSAGTFECQSPLTVASAVYSVAFSPDGSKIAAGHGREIQIFDAQTQAKLGSPLRGDKQINCVAFSSDGKILAAGDGSWNQAGSLRFYDTVTGDVKSRLFGHSRYVTAVSYSCLFANV